MEATAESARTPPFARHEGTRSGSTSDEDDKMASMKWKARLQMASLCWTMFHLAWNREPIGPLMFKLVMAPGGVLSHRLAMTGLLVAAYSGPIFAALVNVYLTYNLGFGKALSLGSALQACAYSIQVLDLPFAVINISCFVTTAAMALQAAHVNSYLINLEDSSSKLGIAHSFYGLGALVSRLLVTRFSSFAPPSPWWHLVSIGISIINFALIIFTFGFRTQDVCMSEMGESAREPETRHRGHYVQMFRRKTLHLMTVFLLIYLSLEVTIGEVIFPHVIKTRSDANDDLSSLSDWRYISPGFFAGLALGRVLLLRVSKKLGNRGSVFFYLVMATIPVSLFWAVPSLISGIVTIFAVGFVLGPVHPIVMNEVGNLIPRWLRTGAIGWIDAVSTTSSRVASAAAGVLILLTGIWWFLPLLLLTLVIMVGLWINIPVNDRTRVD